MSGLLYLIPVALFLGLLGLGAFLWSLKSGQYDDLDGAAERILFDDDDPPPRGRAGCELLGRRGRVLATGQHNEPLQVIRQGERGDRCSQNIEPWPDPAGIHPRFLRSR